MGKLFDNGPVLIILLVAVIVIFGSKRLPDAARGVGRSLRIFKAETKGLMTDDDAPVAQPAPQQVVAAPVAQPVAPVVQPVQPVVQQPVVEQPAPPAAPVAPVSPEAEQRP